MLSCCLCRLNEVLRDVVLQVFVRGSCTAVIHPLYFTELTEHHIGSLSLTLPHSDLVGKIFLLQLVLPGNPFLTGHSHDSLRRTDAGYANQRILVIDDINYIDESSQP